jgi:hypothetical protein
LIDTATALLPGERTTDEENRLLFCLRDNPFGPNLCVRLASGYKKVKTKVEIVAWNPATKNISGNIYLCDKNLAGL